MKALKKILKIILIGIVIIVGLILLTLSGLSLYNTCQFYFDKKEFLAKYEFEDFSQFESVSMRRRGADEHKNPAASGWAPHLVSNNTSRGGFAVFVDKETHRAIRTDLGKTECPVAGSSEYRIIADTVKLRQLGEAFIRYGVYGLRVDTVGNVFVYLKDFETLGLVRFANESERQKSTRKWRRVRGNWYKPR